MRNIYYFRKIIAVLLVVLLFGTLSLAPVAAASSSTTINLWIDNASMSVNGTQQSIDTQGTKPIVTSGRTLVPVRAVIEAFGGSVSWDAGANKISLGLNQNTLELWINKPQASLNGTTKAIDTANPAVTPVIMNGRTMLPLRFVAESLGLDVQYDNETKKITLQKPPLSWTITALDSTGRVGSNSAIAVDANEKVHISYIDRTNENINYITVSDGNWKKWVIGSASDSDTGIAIDTNGKCHIVYNDKNGDLKYATNAPGDSGLIQTIQTGAYAGLFGGEDIAIDSGGTLHVVYFNGAGTLKYATKAPGGVWSASVIIKGTVNTSLPAYCCSIGIDSKNKIHISYYDDVSPDSIKYINNVSGAWEATTIDAIGMSAGWSTSLAVDSNDKIHISYYDFKNNDLKYATNASGKWMPEIVSTDSATFADLAVDKKNGNQVHIVYGTGMGFMYATKSAGLWQLSKLDEMWNNWGSIAIGTENIHVSYSDGYKDDLKYAWKPLQ